MRLFTKKDQETLDRLQYERDMAFESAQRLMEANLRFLEEQNKKAETILHLSREVVRLAQLQKPVVPEGEIEQPKSVSDNDRVTLDDPERLTRPEARPARVD